MIARILPVSGFLITNIRTDQIINTVYGVMALGHFQMNLFLVKSDSATSTDISANNITSDAETTIALGKKFCLSGMPIKKTFSMLKGCRKIQADTSRILR
jgi:hypothetical protein